MIFVGQSTRDTSSLASATGRLVNLYREPVPGGKTQFLLRSTRGMEQFASVDGVFVRDMFEYDGSAIAVCAGQLVKISPDGLLPLGSVALGETAQISRNGQQITVATGGNYYVWADGAISTPATGSVSGAAWVEYLAGRTIVGEVDSAKFAWSEIADPTVVNGLNFATAESRWDKVIRGIVANGLLMLLGERSTEVWAPAGSGASAFSLVPGLVKNVGLKAFGLACRAEGAVFLIGSDGIAYVAAGVEWQAVSTPAVHTAIKDGEPTHCLYWEERGHKFCAITFKDRPAWVYDLTTGEWWERGEGPRKQGWRATHCALMGNQWLIGSVDGAFYTLSDTMSDDGAALYREATSVAAYYEGRWFRVASLEFQLGLGFDDFSIMLEVGDGVSFGPVRSMSFVKGQIGSRAMFRALGAHRTAVARLTMTDPVDVPIYADANLVLA